MMMISIVNLWRRRSWSLFFSIPTIKRISWSLRNSEFDDTYKKRDRFDFWDNPIRESRIRSFIKHRRRAISQTTQKLESALASRLSPSRNLESWESSEFEALKESDFWDTQSWNLLGRVDPTLKESRILRNSEF
jgi:hypothetical protein